MLSGATLTTSSGNLNEVYTYDLFGALLTYHVDYAGAARYYVVYTRDAIGRIATKGEQFGTGSLCTTTYSYDGGTTNTFLTGSSGCSAHSYTYDTSREGNVSSWNYDAQDRLTTDGTWTWSYTANGDVATQTAGTTSINYSYDAFANLRHFNRSDFGGLTFDYAIDGLNRRVFKTCSATGSYNTSICANDAINGKAGWLYDTEGRIIAMLDGSGNATAHFAYVTKSNVPDLMLHNDSGTWNVYRIVSDAIGSPRALIRMSGTGVGSMVESAYGMNDDFGAATSWSSYHPFALAGGQLDYYSGTIRFGARDYSGWQRRWMTKDPIRFDGGLNLYAYCDNDPINCIDPSGNSWFLLGPAVVGLGVVVGEVAGMVIDAAVVTAVADLMFDCLQNGFTACMQRFAVTRSSLDVNAGDNACFAKGGKANIVDTGIMEEVRAEGGDPCAVLDRMLRAANAAGDTVRAGKIKKTQKGLGCRRSSGGGP
jgi:RHS repeat-associated protein